MRWRVCGTWCSVWLVWFDCHGPVSVEVLENVFRVCRAACLCLGGVLACYLETKLQSHLCQHMLSHSQSRVMIATCSCLRLLPLCCTSQALQVLGLVQFCKCKLSCQARADAHWPQVTHESLQSSDMILGGELFGATEPLLR